MYYTKIFLQALRPTTIALLLTLVISACSSPNKANNQNNSKSPWSQSSEQELALYQKAVIALNTHDLATAEALFSQMSQLQPNMAGAWANLALISIKNNKNLQAESYIKTALEKNPNMPQALNLSGYLSAKKGDISLAKHLYLQALNYKPDYALAHYNLALLFDIYLQDIPQAIKHYQQYLLYTDQEDKNTENWLEGLKTTMAANNA
jgi:tetratricopeptide (TPR) repeat protein